MADTANQLLGLDDGGVSVFDKLRTQQVLLAQCLELQFLDLTNYPQTQKEVRMKAHASRTVHSDNVILLQKCVVSGGHIVQTLIPMLDEGLELEEPCLVAGAFQEVLSCIEELLLASEDIRSRYGDVTADIHKTNERVREAEADRYEKNIQQIRKINSEIAAAKLTYDNLKHEIDTLESKRKGLASAVEQHNSTIKQKEAELKQVKDKQKQEEDSLNEMLQKEVPANTHSDVQQRIAIMIGVCTYLTSEQGTKEKELDLLRKSNGEMIAEINKSDRLRSAKVINREAMSSELSRLEKDKQRVASERPISQLGGQKAGSVLEEIVGFLDEICQFWTTMKEHVKPLADEREAARVYKGANESDDILKTFQEKMTLSKQGWERLNKLCRSYVVHFREDSQERLEHIFSFLSAPIGRPQCEVDARVQLLNSKICQEIVYNRM